MLAGELEQIDVEMKRLVERRAVAEKARAACLQTLNLIAQPEPGEEAVLPTVRAHRQYGGRGKLRQFLRDALQAAAPAPLDSNELALMAANKFGLTFSSPVDFFEFQNNSVGRALRCLQQGGFTERVGELRAGPAAWAWRWTTPALPEEVLAEAEQREG